MKNKLMFLSLFAGMALCTACNNASNTAAKGTDSTQKDSSAVATDSSQQPKDSSNRSSTVAPDTADVAFLKKAASGGLLEVQLGTLSGQNGTSPRVKAFGEMMIKDHTDANLNLKTVAAQLQVNVSDSLLPAHAHHKMMLSEKKGTEFDKAYMKMMVADHKEDIADFEKASKSNNPHIKGFASQTLPVLVKHLDSAKAIAAGRLK